MSSPDIKGRDFPQRANVLTRALRASRLARGALMRLLLAVNGEVSAVKDF
jgi:hypothetical protein